jgi:hypothetical protein
LLPETPSRSPRISHLALVVDMRKLCEELF